MGDSACPVEAQGGAGFRQCSTQIVPPSTSQGVCKGELRGRLSASVAWRGGTAFAAHKHAYTPLPVSAKRAACRESPSSLGKVWCQLPVVRPGVRKNEHVTDFKYVQQERARSGASCESCLLSDTALHPVCARLISCIHGPGVPVSTAMGEVQSCLASCDAKRNGAKIRAREVPKQGDFPVDKRMPVCGRCYLLRASQSCL